MTPVSGSRVPHSQLILDFRMHMRLKAMVAEPSLLHFLPWLLKLTWNSFALARAGGTHFLQHLCLTLGLSERWDSTVLFVDIDTNEICVCVCVCVSKLYPCVSMFNMDVHKQTWCKRCISLWACEAVSLRIVFSSPVSFLIKAAFLTFA